MKINCRRLAKHRQGYKLRNGFPRRKACKSSNAIRGIAVKMGESSRAQVAAVVCNCGSSRVMCMVMLTRVHARDSC